MSSQMFSERVFMVISTISGCHIERLTGKELLKRLKESYYGSSVDFVTKERFDRDYNLDLMAYSGLIIIEGNVAVPTPKEVVKEWSI